MKVTVIPLSVQPQPQIGSLVRIFQHFPSVYHCLLSQQSLSIIPTRIHDALRKVLSSFICSRSRYILYIILVCFCHIWSFSHLLRTAIPCSCLSRYNTKVLSTFSVDFVYRNPTNSSPAPQCEALQLHHWNPTLFLVILSYCALHLTTHTATHYHFVQLFQLVWFVVVHQDSRDSGCKFNN